MENIENLNEIEIDNKAQYMKIADEIKNDIISGFVKVGDKLPPEREMAKKYGVSRPSIREAIRSLEIIGLLETRQGDGTYVRNNIKKIIIDSLHIIYNMNEVSIEELIQFREMLEYSAVKLAAVNAADEEIEELGEILSKMKRITTYEGFEKIDILFHQQIAKMSHNILILEMFNAMSSFFNDSMQYSLKLMSLNREECIAVISYHIPIFDAIKDRDPSVAFVFMERHFKKIREIFLN